MARPRRILGVQNRTTVIGTSALLALGGIACNRSTPPAPTATSGQTIAGTLASSVEPLKAPPLPKEDASVVARAFAPYVVTLPKIARRTLYTWTKADQIAALETNPTLLTRSDSPEFGTSYFEQILDERAKNNNKLVKLLRSEAFAKQRYAWVAPFATHNGIGNESYGDELIRIELKPEAWFVVVKVSSPDISVVDMNNNLVPPSEALAHPERIAAAYFVQDKPATGYRASMAGPNERIGYREYVVVNESMIASYSIGTPEIAAEVDNEIQALESLLRYLKTNELQLKHWTAWMVNVTTVEWASEPDSQSAINMYDATLAFADYNYFPADVYVERLVEGLRKFHRRDKPMTHVPTVPFPKAAAQKAGPPPRVWKSGGTF